jgi:hypothetical protein
MQPAWVGAVPRLREDIEALQELTKGKEPLVLQAR